MNRSKLGILFIILCLSFILTSCKGSPKTLTIGLIPVRDAVEMVEDFEPIRGYLEEKLGIPIEVTVAENYASLMEGMKNETIDIGWYGAFSYIAAESEMELTPLVVETRKELGMYYHSLIIAQKDAGVRYVEDLKGKKFAFVDPGSTSGFVLPYALFKSRNIDYEQFFSEFYYAGSHEEVPSAILHKNADAGAISEVTFKNMIKDGKINRDDFVVIWKSEAIPWAPYVARSELDKEVQENFTEAMLNVHNDLPAGLHAFDNSIEKYIVVDSKEYNTIRNIAAILGKDYMYEYFLKGE
jgi:phosphonate transport system substrate-binding protein